MNHTDFTSALAQAVNADAAEGVLDGACRAAELPAVPLNSFFGDELLTLLYRSTGPCARPLAEMKRCLTLVCDPKEARHVRAAAAVALGRFVLARRPEGDEYVLGSSNPQDWFQLARQFNSVVGALALANTLLAQRGQRVEFNLEVDPLPRLVESGERTFRMPPVVSHDIAQAWYLGARVALRHVQRNFCGWDREAFGCALACVVNYLTLLPGRHMSASMSPLVQRREALAWIKPLWNRLIEAAAQQVGDGYSGPS